MKAAIILFSLLMVSQKAGAQVKFSEIIFHPSWDKGTKECIVTKIENNAYGYFNTTKGSEFVDFIPVTHQGEYSISVRDYVAPEKNDLDGGLNAYKSSLESERLFKIVINTKKKVAPLEVTFDCNWECNASITSIKTERYLPKILSTTSNVKIMIFRAPTYDAELQAAQVASTLRHYGFKVNIAVSDNCTKESWKSYYGEYSLFPAYRQVANSFITTGMVNFLCRVLEYNHGLNGFPNYGVLIRYFEGYDFWFALPTW